MSVNDDDDEADGARGAAGSGNGQDSGWAIEMLRWIVGRAAAQGKFDIR